MTTPRVAFVLTQDRGGPVDLTTALLAELRDHHNVPVRLFGPLPARDPERVTGCHELVKVGSKTSLRAMTDLQHAVLDWHPDVVHAQDRRAGLVFSRPMRAVSFVGHRSTGSGRRPAVLHTYHGVPDDVGQDWFAEGRGPKPSKYTMATLLADAGVARGVDRSIVPAPSMATFLTQRLRVPAHRVAHLDNGLVLGNAHPPQQIRSLLFVGLLERRKGVHHLLDALAQASRQHPDLTLLVAGDGSEAGALKRQASALGLDGRVRFLGFRKDVSLLLQETDAFVLPSSMEQQPLVLIEAMAAGKPLVVTATGGVPDMVRGLGGAVHVVAPGDVPALARALAELTLMLDPAAAGARVAAVARARFSVQSCALGHLGLYREVLDQLR